MSWFAGDIASIMLLGWKKKNPLVNKTESSDKMKFKINQLLGHKHMSNFIDFAIEKIWLLMDNLACYSVIPNMYKGQTQEGTSKKEDSWKHKFAWPLWKGLISYSSVTQYNQLPELSKSCATNNSWKPQKSDLSFNTIRKQT